MIIVCEFIFQPCCLQSGEEGGVGMKGGDEGGVGMKGGVREEYR